MNNLIQKFADQAEDYADNMVDQGSEFHPTYTKKLVELIVQECARFIEDTFDFCGDEIIAAEKLIEHFKTE